MAVPHRSGLESCGHNVTVGKTILFMGKVSTTDFMGFSIQPASSNFILNFWLLISTIQWFYNGRKPSLNGLLIEQCKNRIKKITADGTGYGTNFMINRSLCCRLKEWSE